MLFIAVGSTVGYILICTYRVIYQTLGYYGFFAEQANLSLMTQANLNCATAGLTGWRFRVDSARLLGLKSNLILVARR
jgi:hypothetical protein